MHNLVDILAEIETELSRVRDDKETMLTAIRDKEAEELRLTRLAEGLREFLGQPPLLVPKSPVAWVP